MKRLCLTLILAAALAACVTPPPEFSNGTPVVAARSFTLDQTHAWRQRLDGMTTHDTEFMLAKGTYRAELENAQGTLFRGPKRAVAYQVVGGYQVTSGGVWISRNPQEKPRLYVYAGSDEVRPGDRAEILQAMASGTTSALADAPRADVSGLAFPTIPRNAGAEAGARAAQRVFESTPRPPPKEKPGRPALLWEIHEPALETLVRAGTP